MTDEEKRLFYAAFAMQGLIASGRLVFNQGILQSRIVDDAFTIADAMVKESNKEV